MRRLRNLFRTHLRAPIRRIVPILVVGVILLAIATPALALRSTLAQDAGSHVIRSDVAPLVNGAAVVIGGAVSGTVFFDANGDGVRGPDETHGVEGAVVALQTAGGAQVASYTTLTDGAYQFSNVAAGSYLVVETDGFGWASTTSNSQSVTVSATPLSGINFGDTLPFHLTGVIYNDLNGDGVQQPSEKGLWKVPVDLYNDLNADGLIDASDPLLASTETDEQGSYSFHNVMPGYRVLRVRPPVGSSSPSGSQAALNLISFDGGMGVNEFFQNFPLLPDTGTPPACAFNTSIVSSFNGTPIPAPRVVWFTARLKATGLVAGVETTVYFDNADIQFGAGATPYHLLPGRAKVVFSPTAASTTTTYDAATQTWTTTVSPGNWGKDVFLSGLRLAAPAAGLPGGINPVTWSGRLSSTRAMVKLEWKWSAAVYTSLATDYNALGVKAASSNVENSYNNSDIAGTPENYKGQVTGGARGGGGSNYTGGNSATVRGLCITVAVPPYRVFVNCGSMSFTDSLGQVWNADQKYRLGTWGYLDGTAKSTGTQVGGTADDFLYQRYREAPLEYRFTAPNDTYKVQLRFAEFSAQRTGERVMRITMEGVEVEPALDIYAAAGRYNKLDKTYQVTVSDGMLNIVFEKVGASARPPAIAAIGVTPLAAGVNASGQ